MECVALNLAMTAIKTTPHHCSNHSPPLHAHHARGASFAPSLHSCHSCVYLILLLHTVVVRAHVFCVVLTRHIDSVLCCQVCGSAQARQRFHIDLEGVFRTFGFQQDSDSGPKLLLQLQRPRRTCEVSAAWRVKRTWDSLTPQRFRARRVINLSQHIITLLTL